MRIQVTIINHSLYDKENSDGGRVSALVVLVVLRRKERNLAVRCQ